MRGTILAGTAAAFVLAMGYSTPAKADCYWTGFGWACPGERMYQTIQPRFYGPQPLDPRRDYFRGQRPDSHYPGRALVGGLN